MRRVLGHTVTSTRWNGATRHAGGRVLPQPHSRDQRRVLILSRISSNR
jgi:hypothetical protein